MSSFEVQSLFYQGAYKGCIELASLQSVDPSNQATQQNLLYAARSHIALSDPGKALALLPASLAEGNIAVGAVRQLAKFVASQQQGNAKSSDEALASLIELLDEAVVGDPKGEVVRVCAGTAMARDGDPLGALETLDVASEKEGKNKELECVALGIHILLSINRVDLAQKEFTAARSWADDSLLIQLIEAWIGLVQGGRSSQQAYYVYDELAQNPAQAGKPSTVNVLTGKAAAQMVLGQWKAAAATLEHAEKLDPSNESVLANRVALAPHLSRTPESLAEAMQKLQARNTKHPVLIAYNEREAAFDEVAAKFTLSSEA
ncbi:hypothetical protein K437DRAFT_251559 [Tilletiaria anomala UBC 951]|uniref:Coatomer subunit epsilon n=1 Tax=Tilletiaria anomala (strain ATCC 24038 / CBS 436.72 / UBC 951) TaxID=1037660 RepID=A0A066V944_TILAU|nr:uncharacterized protein K437DRAFT_251559 [Tilletiaria anomala UBC 951]KDN37991.1 hypothetical protein K437DRAFT_251559 [Tilletiaria anomala UBC 951]